MIGKTNAQIGASFNGETVVIQLVGSGENDTNLNGVNINVSYDELTSTYTWNGNQIKLEIPTGKVYTVSTFDVDGYELDTNSYGFTAQEKNIRTITFNYIPFTEDTHSCWVIFDDTVSSTTLEIGGSQDMRNLIRSKFRRCVARPNDDGTASIAYLSDTDSNVFPDGSSASGSYFMVHFPKYYYRCEETETNIWKYYVSIYPLDGYKEERECLVGVFEAYWDTATETKLISIGGVASVGGKTITQFFEYAQENGSNWGLIDYRVHKTIANMFAIMYGSRDISNLHVNIPCSGGSKAYNANTGDTLSLGNKDGLVNNSSSFLGLEDCYCGKWEFVQGANIYASYAYGFWALYDGLKVNTTAVDLESAGYTNVREYGTDAHQDGFITQLSHGEFADVIPTEVGGSTSTYYADYFYGNDNFGVLLRSGRGGSSAEQLNAGVFITNTVATSTATNAVYGTRLAFYGQINVISPSEL